MAKGWFCSYSKLSDMDQHRNFPNRGVSFLSTKYNEMKFMLLMV